MAYAAGTMIGPLLAGFIKEKAGWGTATLVLGCISFVCVVPTVTWCGGSIFKAKRREKAEKVVETEEPSKTSPVSSTSASSEVNV
jgi:MFS family permease